MWAQSSAAAAGVRSATCGTTETQEVEVLSECETSPLLSLSLGFLFLHLKDLIQCLGNDYQFINVLTLGGKGCSATEKNNFHSTSGPVSSERGWVILQGRDQTPIKPRPSTEPRPGHTSPAPSREPRLPGRRGRCAWGPAEALWSWGSGPGERAERAGRGGADRGGADRGGRKESQAGRRQRRAGGRSGPGTAGPERQSRHVRQRETQPGLYHRAPAGRLAGGGGGRRPLRPDPRPAWK